MAHYYAVPLIAVTVVTLMTKPVLAGEVACLYDSNSEWPWASSRVCQLVDSPLISNDAGQPYCSDARADKDGDGWGWENGGSCIIDPDQPAKQSTVPGLVVNQEDFVVFEQDFESASVGTYTPEVLNEQWHTPLWHMGVREGRAKIVADSERGKALEVLFPANKFGSDGAVAFLNDLSFGSGVKHNFEELYISYDVKFSDNFEFVQGGKLPGLCGYNITQDPRDGCNTGGGFPDGYDGWSARGMWRDDGKLENYMYHADQFYQYGDDEYWSKLAERGKWHTFQHRIVLNTVGDANGIVEAWLDGVKVLSSNTMLYRKTEDIKINLFYFSTFYGGADPSWAPKTDQYIYFDNFRIATTPLPETGSPAAAEELVAKQAVEVSAAVPAEGVEVDAAITAEEVEIAAAIPLEEVDSDSVLTAIESAQEAGVSRDSKLPELAAANEIESGGGVFYPWVIGLLMLLRRKL